MQQLSVYIYPPTSIMEMEINCHYAYQIHNFSCKQWLSKLFSLLLGEEKSGDKAMDKCLNEYIYLSRISGTSSNLPVQGQIWFRQLGPLLWRFGESKFY